MKEWRCTKIGSTHNWC